MELTTEEFSLTKFKPEDIDSRYLGWLNNKYHMKYSDQRHVRHTEESANNFLESFTNSDNFFLSIIDPKNEKIGTVTIYYDKFNHQANAGFLVAPEVSGKGIGTFVLTTLIEGLPKIVILKKLSCGTCELNLPMLKVFQKSGLVEDYRDRNSFFFEGKYYDKLIFAKYY